MYIPAGDTVVLGGSDTPVTWNGVDVTDKYTVDEDPRDKGEVYSYSDSSYSSSHSSDSSSTGPITTTETTTTTTYGNDGETGSGALFTKWGASVACATLVASTLF